MTGKILRHPNILAFVCGSLCVGALPPYYLFPLLFAGLSGLLYLIDGAPSSRKAFGIAYAFGFAFFAFGLSWIGNALLIDAQTFGWLYPVVFLACGFFFGLFIAVPGWLAFRLFHSPASRWLAFSSFWVLFEWIRSFILTGFPWNLLGSVFAFSPEMIQFASQAGTYGLSLICLLSCSAPYFYLRRRTQKNLAAAICIPLVGLGFLYGFGYFRLPRHPLPQSATVIRLVQPAIPQAMKWNPQTLENNFQKYISMSKAPGREKVSLVIWGETAAPFPLDMDETHLLNIADAVPPQGHLVTGLVRYEFTSPRSHRAYNSMFVINKKAEIVDYYDKSHLVPFGEYIPLRSWLPQWIRPVANTIGTFKAGSGPRRISVPGLPSFGGLICYEIIFPHQIINPNERPQWLINLTNDGWYGESAGPYQHLVTTQLRAVEEGISIARVANTGISALISPFGTILGQISLNKSEILDINLPQSTQFSTTYSYYGDITVLITLIFNFILAFYLSSRNL